jgi:hypothetical protein
MRHLAATLVSVLLLAFAAIGAQSPTAAFIAAI